MKKLLSVIFISISLSTLNPTFLFSQKKPVVSSSAINVSAPTKVAGIHQRTVSLNGVWSFNPTPTAEFWNFSSSAEGEWKDIKVPGEWKMQGFDVPKNTRAAYQRNFSVPGNWSDLIIKLRCDAIYSDAVVWINGKKAGSHHGGLTAFELDVTKLIQKGENKITIGVQSESLADSLGSITQYAAHQMGGILRKIYLIARPKVYVSSLQYETDLDYNYKDASLKIRTTVTNASSKAQNASVKVTLTDPSGNEVELQKNSIQLGKLLAGASIEKELVLAVKSPLKWDAEHPNLYKMEIVLSSGKSSEHIKEKVGFRKIEVIGNQLFVNGSSIKLKGVNRHEVHPLLGRSLNNALWKKDAELFKKANVNYIRTSHYPPSEEFISICDSIGLYVELENPLCWIGHHANSKWVKEEPHNPRFYPYMEQVTRENISFFRNHPSIIIWSMANESAWGPNWTKLFELCNKLDQTRPKAFHDQAYGGFNNYGSTGMQIANIHYPGPQGPKIAENFSRPLLFGEYTHLNTYNREEIATDPGVRDAWGRGFKEMWENMNKSRGCLGGAIWSGIDDVFYLPDGRAIGYGEWGPIDGWRREKPEYYHMKKSYSPVKIHSTQINVPEGNQPIKLQIENRFDFTNLSECKILWTIAGESGEAKMNLVPGGSGILKINPKMKNIEGKIMQVKIYSPQAYMVDQSSIEIGHVKRDNFPFNIVESGKLNMIKSEKEIVIKGKNMQWHFDRKVGKISKGVYQNKEIISDGANLMILPLKTGPCDTEHSLNIPFLNNTCGKWVVNKAVTSQNGDTIKIAVTGSYDEANGDIEYLFLPSGELNVKYAFTIKKDVDPRQWGLVFSVNREFENLQWYRNGIWSDYPENHIGRVNGKAIPFGKKAFMLEKFGAKPEREWKYDANSLGTNDFRSSKDNIYWASLTNEDGVGIIVTSGGKKTFRSFVDGNNISFLVADFATGGGDLFFASHHRNERKPLKTGDRIKGSATLYVVNNKK